VNELTPLQKDVIGRVTYLRQDVTNFQQTWPRLNTAETLPPMTWGELERQLVSLSANLASAEMVRELVAATRKQAPFKPSEMVMREILCIASAVMDETFLSDSEASSPDWEADDLTN